MNWAKAFSTTLVFIVSFTIFGSIVLYFEISTDIQAHIGFLINISSGDASPPANFLYYLVLYCFAFSKTDFLLLGFSSSLVLSAAVAAKYLITQGLFESQLGRITKEDPHFKRLVTLYCLSLVFVFTVPFSVWLNDPVYLGQITPTVWHNSTTIFLVPFALYLFWVSYEHLLHPTKARLAAITLLCILNILIKPSFFFVFTMAYPLMLLKQFGMKKQMWLSSLSLLPGVLLVILQYFLIYRSQSGIYYQDDVGTAFGFFSVWSDWTSNIPVALAGSTLFPVVYLCFYRKDLRDSLLLQYAVCAYIVALCIFSFIHETGARKLHGNFLWQCVICSYILFAVVSIRMLDRMFADRVGKPYSCSAILNSAQWRHKVILGCYVLHVTFGFLYLGKLFIFRDYL